jgi:hypothetical protein
MAIGIDQDSEARVLNWITARAQKQKQSLGRTFYTTLLANSGQISQMAGSIPSSSRTMQKFLTRRVDAPRILASQCLGHFSARPLNKSKPTALNCSRIRLSLDEIGMFESDDQKPEKHGIPATMKDEKFITK